MFTRLTGRILLLTVLSLLLATFAGVAAQETARNKPGCTLIDAAQHGQFISYEKTVKREVLLRLHNNTDCPIAVEIDDKDQLADFRKLPNCENLFVYVRGPRDGIRLSLHYLIQDRPHSRMPVPGYSWGDSVSTYAIPKGQSVILAVPLTYFSKRFDVLVPFKFSWEDQDTINTSSGAVTHRVYFLADQLPRSAHRRKP